MEYYIVRIYRRESGQNVDSDLRHIRITGLVEDCNGHKEFFHDADALGRLLAQEKPSVAPDAPLNKS